jgi:hypothetical protein
MEPTQATAPNGVRSAAEILAGATSIQVDKYITKAEGGIDSLLGKKMIVQAIAERTSSYVDPETGKKGKFYAVQAQVTVKQGKGKNAAEVTRTIGFNVGGTVLPKQLLILQPFFPQELVLEKVDKGNGYRYYQVKQN